MVITKGSTIQVIGKMNFKSFKRLRGPAIQLKITSTNTSELHGRRPKCNKRS